MHSRPVTFVSDRKTFGTPSLTPTGDFEHLALEESAADVVLLQHRNMRRHQELAGLAREREHALEGRELAIDGAVRSTVRLSLRYVGTDISGGEVRHATTAEPRPQTFFDSDSKANDRSTAVG